MHILLPVTHNCPFSNQLVRLSVKFFLSPCFLKHNYYRDLIFCVCLSIHQYMCQSQCYTSFQVSFMRSISPWTLCLRVLLPAVSNFLLVVALAFSKGQYRHLVFHPVWISLTFRTESIGVLSQRIILVSESLQKNTWGSAELFLNRTENCLNLSWTVTENQLNPFWIYLKTVCTFAEQWLRTSWICLNLCWKLPDF